MSNAAKGHRGPLRTLDRYFSEQCGTRPCRHLRGKMRPQSPPVYEYWSGHPLLVSNKVTTSGPADCDRAPPTSTSNAHERAACLGGGGANNTPTPSSGPGGRPSQRAVQSELHPTLYNMGWRNPALRVPAQSLRDMLPWHHLGGRAHRVRTHLPLCTERPITSILAWRRCHPHRAR